MSNIPWRIKTKMKKEKEKGDERMMKNEKCSKYVWFQKKSSK